MVKTQFYLRSEIDAPNSSPYYLCGKPMGYVELRQKGSSRQFCFRWSFKPAV